jgi:hypothetical protein
VSPKRGDRAAPPPRPDEFDLRFANTEAAKGWDELCRHAPGNTRTAFDAIRANPSPAPSSERHHRLKYDLATGVHNGQVLEQWQYEVTGGGRIWYLINYETRTVWLTYARPGHPKATDR